jgi:hypothetical protein
MKSSVMPGTPVDISHHSRANKTYDPSSASDNLKTARKTDSSDASKGEKSGGLFGWMKARPKPSEAFLGEKNR